MRTDIPGIAAGGSAMFLVGTLTGVTALINSYPVYGGQALRYAAAAVILLAVASARRLPPARLTPRDVLLLAALAAVGMVGFNVCVIEATRAASPAMVGTVVGAVPVALAIAGPLLTGPAGRRRPSPRVAAAAGIIVAGAALTAGLGTGSLRGLLFASGALACEAGFSLLAMPLLPKLGPIRASGYAAAAAVPMALAAAAIADGPGMLRMPTTAQAAGLAYLAVVVSAGAFALWYTALPRLGADRAGLLAGVVPIGAIATTVTLGLGHPTSADLAGAALVTAGLLLGMAPRGRPTPHARALPATPPAPAARYVDTGTGHNQQRGAVPFSIGLTATSLTGEKAQASRQARRQPGGRDHGLRLRAGLHQPADGGESPGLRGLGGVEPAPRLVPRHTDRSAVRPCPAGRRRCIGVLPVEPDHRLRAVPAPDQILEHHPAPPHRLNHKRPAFCRKAGAQAGTNLLRTLARRIRRRVGPNSRPDRAAPHNIPFRCGVNGQDLGRHERQNGGYTRQNPDQG